MKLLLGILALVFISVDSQMSQQEFQTKVKEALLPLINTERREFDRIFGVGRTPDMKWDENLVSEARGLSSTCDARPMEHIYMFGTGAAYDNLLKGYIAIYEGQINSGKTKYALTSPILGLNTLNPEAKSIGCAINSCTSPVGDKFKQALGITADSITFPFVCVIGPSVDWTPGDIRVVESKSSDLIEYIKKPKTLRSPNPSPPPRRLPRVEVTTVFFVPRQNPSEPSNKVEIDNAKTETKNAPLSSAPGARLLVSIISLIINIVL